MTDFFWRLGDVLPDVASVGYDVTLTVEETPWVMWTPDPGASPLENYVLSELDVKTSDSQPPKAARAVVVTGVLYGGRTATLVPTVSMRSRDRSATVAWGTGPGLRLAAQDAVVLPPPRDARELEHLLVYLPIRFAQNKPLDVGYPFREELARVADLLYGMDARMRRADVESRVRRTLVSDLERRVRRHMDAMTKALAKPANYLVDVPFSSEALDGGSWVSIASQSIA
jgi:hypothetical protein